ncbi:thiol reductant ABC exporter subunit CydD [Halobacillus shinanisalinarum]|uniref:Thiol reductant ABC exporter subunit CydD n=1 Tax=Halobacillus shinanisalinarum TaxID=2932258 RepID=A0ABY4GU92_9BACI|nr:thiol reductant ABC exporter subunit CydD [Halobacillus shinanisalinarum]UOQ91594.1 thiol reductant ABC exporter subunit CydD [Halobacillus shinanisalinarum]
MKHLSKMAFGQRNMITLLVVSAICIGAMIVGQAYFFVTIVDRIYLGGQSFEEIIPLLAGLLLVIIVRTLLTHMNGRTGVKIASKAKREFRESLLSKFSRNPIQASLKGQSGQKVSVLMDAVDEVDPYFSSYVPQIIQSTIVPLMILIVVFTQHLNSGLIIIVTAPFIPFFMIVIGMKTKDKSEEQMDKLAAFSGRFLDTLQGLTTLKLFGRSVRQKGKIRESSIDFREATMEVLKIAFVSSFMLELISMLSIGLIALEVAIQLVVYESISFFTAFFILVLAPEFFAALKDLGSAFHTGRGSAGAAKKVTNELEEPEQAVQWGEQELQSAGKPPVIELRNLAFSYGEDRFTLNHIQTSIPAYGQIAIVGRSGAGKTTLLHMMAGLVNPTEGEIAVEGQPLSSYKEQEWFDQLSYISQHPYLFSGTIAENIAIGGRNEASRAEIDAAANKAGLSDLVERLANGLNTSVGEAGRGLSGGEQQRVAIARAFLKRPSVILFDEPTTGLDLQTERILQESINELSKTSTVITVAHRLHTIKRADNILFLDHGQLVGQGTHEDLMQSVSEYRNMVSAQQGSDAS